MSVGELEVREGDVDNSSTATSSAAAAAGS